VLQTSSITLTALSMCMSAQPKMLWGTSIHRYPRHWLPGASNFSYGNSATSNLYKSASGPEQGLLIKASLRSRRTRLYYAYPGSVRLPRSVRINCAECIKGHEANRFYCMHCIRLLQRPILSDLTIVLWKGDDKKKRPQKRRFLTVRRPWLSVTWPRFTRSPLVMTRKPDVV
jgi:hypothetical protein